MEGGIAPAKGRVRLEKGFIDRGIEWEIERGNGGDPDVPAFVV